MWKLFFVIRRLTSGASRLSSVIKRSETNRTLFRRSFSPGGSTRRFHPAVLPPENGFWFPGPERLSWRLASPSFIHSLLWTRFLAFSSFRFSSFPYYLAHRAICFIVAVFLFNYVRVVSYPLTYFFFIVFLSLFFFFSGEVSPFIFLVLHVSIFLYS